MDKRHPEDKKPLDLRDALRILKNAGWTDPRFSIEDPDVQIIIDALCHVSIHDGLTGLVNATFFHAVLSREIERSLRTGRACGLMVIDLDYFKHVNDTYGHTMGDSFLQAFAAHLKQGLRAMDTAARIGGEEFAIILPECEPQDAIHAAARIHSTVNPFTYRTEQAVVSVTTSAGLVWTHPSISMTSGALVSEADREMYRAKQSGRSRLCYTPPVDILVSHPEKTALMALRKEEDTHDR